MWNWLSTICIRLCVRKIFSLWSLGLANFKFDITRRDVNSPWSEERGKFDVIFASNSIHCGRRMRTVLSNISNALND